MLIDCPRCWTRYRIAADKLRPSGTRLKCTRCGLVFRGSVYDAMSEPGESREEQLGASSKEFPDWEGIEEDSGRTGKKRRGWLWLLFGLLLAAAAAYALLFATGARLQLSFSLSQGGPLEASGAAADTELVQRPGKEEAARDIALRNVNQYMVRNKHLGSLLVIEGRAENESRGAKKDIRLRATVFDRQGEELRSKEFSCGSEVSLARLQSSGKSELKSVFADSLDQSGGTRIPAGDAMPFMTVFFSPPQEMAEFSLRVLQAAEAASS